MPFCVRQSSLCALSDAIVRSTDVIVNLSYAILIDINSIALYLFSYLKASKATVGFPELSNAPKEYDCQLL